MVGQGSPTNLMFGTEANFPEKYRKALYAFDWSFGIIYAIHLEPSGATYEASAEEFISGSPLPLTDGVVGPDGAMYFMTGGRRLESDVYRVYYTDEIKDERSSLTAEDLPEEHHIRRQLEAYHEGPKAGATDFAWPYLKHEDRFIQYAARIAVEHQPLNEWKSKALNEKDPATLIQAMIALARHGDKATANQMLQSLMTIDYDQLSERDEQNLARAFELILYRHGNPTGAIKNQLVEYLNPHFPAGNNNLDRALAKVLVYLGAPDAVEKTLALLDNAQDDESYQKTFTSSSDLVFRNPQYGLDIANMLSNVPPAQQTYLATVLGGAKVGWTEESFEEYFNWVHKAFEYKGGRSYVGFIDRARKMALAQVPQDKFEYYNELSGAALLSSSGNELLVSTIQPEGPGRRWTVEEALPLMDSLQGRDIEKGKAMFAASQCLGCHNMRGEGGIAGPDLTQLGTRFSPRDILVHTIDPSAEISDQYAATNFYMNDGSSIIGKLANENETTYFVSQNPFAPQDIREIPKSEVSSTKLSDVSIMMPALINRLNAEELKDLMAYLVSGGNPDHEAFK